MAWPDRISVYHKLRAAPTASTDSFILDVLILSERHQRPAARCVEDIVVYDYRVRTFLSETCFGSTRTIPLAALLLPQ